MSLPADTEAYMLHRSPMRLVHRLLCVLGDYAEGETTLCIGDVGVAPDGRVEGAVLLELVAQTYAAAQGHEDRAANKVGRMGYLVGTQDFRVEDLPPAGQPLLVKIKSSRSFGDFYLVDGQVFCEGRVVAGGIIKAWVQPDTQ
ncbi:MAG: hypothetical protein JW955_04290 [Sedimentisphaerales bacterium]|nr:hypothetical protein [Sedimentisphaerales bacterium]